MLVYMPAEAAKMHLFRFAYKFVGPCRILEVTENSALFVHIGKNEQAFKVQLGHLRKVPYDPDGSACWIIEVKGVLEHRGEGPESWGTPEKPSDCFTFQTENVDQVKFEQGQAPLERWTCTRRCSGKLIGARQLCKQCGIGQGGRSFYSKRSAKINCTEPRN